MDEDSLVAARDIQNKINKRAPMESSSISISENQQKKIEQMIKC